MATSNSGRVEGKVALVTGAASGIGEGTALLLAREGAAVAVVDIDVEAGKRTTATIVREGGKAIFIRADVGKTAQVKRMIERTASAFGRLDIIHNNAIWFRNGKATELDEKDWDRTLDVGLKTVFLSAKFGVPAMRETGGGSIVNTASVHSLVSFEEHTAYDAAKAGLLGLTRVLALDFGPDIRVNSVLPGAVLTPLWKGISRADRRRFADMVPAKRLGTPEDIASAVLFLASEEASFITGTSLVVDGGLIARSM
ncbi:MAG: SDR family oxidoreductase [Candidatus Latescibacterota bacterium]|nr:SDR family oxidoreductase [Candidatus Latescibacterota bacterium]